MFVLWLYISKGVPISGRVTLIIIVCRGLSALFGFIGVFSEISPVVMCFTQNSLKIELSVE